jgi:hypothetical protein
VSPSDIQTLAFGTLQGLLISTGFLLALFIGFCVLVGFSKHRRTGRHTLVVRNITERMGVGFRYLPPDAPRGPADQLRTPELLEQSGRKA